MPEAAAIMLGDQVGLRKFIILEDSQFRQKDRRLQRVKSAVDPGSYTLIFILRTSSLCPQAAKKRIRLIIIRKQRAAVSIAAKRLCREERRY